MLRDGSQFIFAFAYASAIFLAPLVAEARQSDKLIGSWSLKRDASKGTGQDRVFHSFEFKDDGTVVAYVVMSDVFGPGMGEALGDVGHYSLRGNRLVIKSSKTPGEGWPTDRVRGRIEYSCKVHFPVRGKDIRLSKCPIAGTLIYSSQ